MECVNVMEKLLCFFGVICYKANYGDSVAVSFVIFMVTMLFFHKSKVCMK